MAICKDTDESSTRIGFFDLKYYTRADVPENLEHSILLHNGMNYHSFPCKVYDTILMVIYILIHCGMNYYS